MDILDDMGVRKYQQTFFLFFIFFYELLLNGVSSEFMLSLEFIIYLFTITLTISFWSHFSKL